MIDKIKKLKLYRIVIFIRNDIEEYLYENMYSIINIKKITTDLFDICKNSTHIKPEIDLSYVENFVIKLNFDNNFLLKFDIQRGEFELKK